MRPELSSAPEHGIAYHGLLLDSDLFHQDRVRTQPRAGAHLAARTDVEGRAEDRVSRDPGGLVDPAAAARCRVEFDYYYAQDPATLARIGRDQGFSDEIQAEDIAICEAVQKGLASGRYQAGRLCPKRESGLWHFHQRLRAAYAR